MKRTISTVLAIAMLVCVFASALPTGAFAWTQTKDEVVTPDGYNDHEYQALVEFFQQTDLNGVSNGEKLNEEIDLADPETWQHTAPQYYTTNVSWVTFENELHVRNLDLSDFGMVGLIDLSGFSFVKQIDLPGNDLSQVELTDAFEGLTRLNLQDNENLGSVDVSGFPALINLNVQNCGITELDLSNNPALYYLYCGYNNLTELDLSANTALWWLYCSDNNLTELDLTVNTAIGPLDCSNNSLTTLDLSNCPGIWTLTCNDNELENIIFPEAFSGRFGFSALLCQNNNLGEINMPEAPTCCWFNCANNNISELDLASMGRLEELYCNGNQLTSLDLSNNPDIYALYFQDNNIEEIDLSMLTKLVLLDGEYMDSFVFTSNGYVGEDELTNFPVEVNLTAQLGGKVKAELAADIDEDSNLYPKPHINGRLIISARADEGYTFEGWYDENGELYSTQNEITFTDGNLMLNLEARFASGSPAYQMGDANGDGNVDFADAVTILRHAMDILAIPDELLPYADFNGDGEVDSTDALLIMRLALELA